LFVLAIDAGLRPSESRALKRRDVTFREEPGDIRTGEVVVSRSKTESGTGRVVPLTNRAIEALVSWLARFPDAQSSNYLFPFHRVVEIKKIGSLWDVDLNRPMGQWNYKRAFETAQKRSGVSCRFYDARHTFVTRLAEDPSVAVETIRQLAGHVNDRMLARYAHIRVEARRGAIAALERGRLAARPFDESPGRAQNWAQSPANEVVRGVRESTKTNGDKGFRLVGVSRFERPTTRTPSVCATRLRHTPT
jgi:integrase